MNVALLAGRGATSQHGVVPKFIGWPFGILLRLSALPVEGGEAFVDIVYAEVHYRLDCE